MECSKLTERDKIFVCEKINLIPKRDQQTFLNIISDGIPHDRIIKGVDGSRIDLDSLEEEHHRTILNAIEFLKKKIEEYEKPIL